MNIKRLVDLVLVILTLPLWLSVLALAGLAIALDSRGPVFFTQKRMGWRQRPFTLYKLRTMDPAKAPPKGVLFEGWTYSNDPRVTRVGRFLRKYRIDELPQCLNVLRGDMSLVGPRPEPWDIAVTLGREIPQYHRRHRVRPGLTGLCQISPIYSTLGTIARSSAKAELDLDYVRKKSLTLDAAILMKTVGVVLRGVGVV